MENTRELRFETPSFMMRLKGMLGVDFYRLFHTPMFYIFLAIAAIIPAMLLGETGTEEGTTPLFTNTWQIVAADSPLYIVNEIGEYANMNMVFIFGDVGRHIQSSRHARIEKLRRILKESANECDRNQKSE